MDIVLLFLWFGIKHFICDFPLQAFPWMYENKRILGHPGGLVHAGVHFIGTAIVLQLATNLGPIMVFGLAFLDFFVHYFIDWGKMNLNAKLGLKPDNSEWFWILLGVDQLLHFVTYVGIVALLV
jgi:hypothetical protein